MIKAEMKIKETIQRFSQEEDGIALTEYLILLGLLVGGVILAVLAFGNALSNLWNGWTAWFSSGVILAPT
jgi:pilus assembly protein Flp/PilA